MKQVIAGFFNPLKLIRAWSYQRTRKKYHKASHDLELNLYHQMLRNDMLHWGYFDDPDRQGDSISVHDFERAQLRYAENIMALLGDKNQAVLDVGCGMGGIAAMISREGYRMELLSPHTGQKEYLQRSLPDLPFHHVRYEQFQTDKQYGTILNAESLQYIPLEEAFQQTERLLKSGGRWIVSDYFRIHEKGRNRSGHMLAAFVKMAKDTGFAITYERDMTAHVLPTIRMAEMYARRFLIPLADFGFAKLKSKRPWLYYMLKDLEGIVEKKINKEMAAIDPMLFIEQKKYMLFVLEKNV
jgi:MPBQ/MSBQ methyltransferase